MALSNWDTLAVNESGKATGGSFVSPLGVEVMFYKNWLYIQDAKAWRDGGGFVESTVMKVNEGVMQYLDVNILALRGPQEGIYAVVWSGYEHDNTLQGMVGCGVYGYEGDEFVGVKSESLEWFRGALQTTEVLSMPVPTTLSVAGKVVCKDVTYDSAIYDIPETFRGMRFEVVRGENLG